MNAPLGFEACRGRGARHSALAIVGTLTASACAGQALPVASVPAAQAPAALTPAAPVSPATVPPSGPAAPAPGARLVAA